MCCTLHMPVFLKHLSKAETLVITVSRQGFEPQRSKTCSHPAWCVSSPANCAFFTASIHQGRCMLSCLVIMRFLHFLYHACWLACSFLYISAYSRAKNNFGTLVRHICVALSGLPRDKRCQSRFHFSGSASIAEATRASSTPWKCLSATHKGLCSARVIQGDMHTRVASASLALVLKPWLKHFIGRRLWLGVGFGCSQ